MKHKLVLRFVSAASAAATCCCAVYLERTTQFVFVNGTVFYASKVRKDVLFMEYAWDDVKIMSLRNELSHVGKHTVITVKLRFDT